MGCAASTDGAGRRRRDRAKVHSEASTTAVPAAPKHDPPPDARMRARKAVPEPEDGVEPPHELPSSPSFRFYCQKAAKVDALVAAAADADDGGPATATESRQAIIPPPQSSNESSESKEANGWLKFRGTGIAAAMSSLFGRHRTAASASAPPPPAAAAKSAAPSPAVS